MSASQIRAFAPGHITGFFQIFENGSTGAGLNTAFGANTTVEFSKDSRDRVVLNNEESDASVSQAVLESFAKFRQKGESVLITHCIEYPIGYGMGMSGAGAFSLSLALNELFNAQLDYAQCMLVAKECEIRCGTGLGDVVAQQFPGVMMGLPPYPSSEVRQIEGSEKYVVCAFFEPLSTESIIRDPKWVERINTVGAECMRLLESSCSRRSFMELSRKFAVETELPSAEVRRVMDLIPGSSMAMLGQSVFALCDSVAEGMKKFEQHAEHIVVSRIADTGARVYA